MTLVLGNLPALGRLALIDGQDFAHTFTAYSTIPVGTVLALEILNATRTTTLGIWPVEDLSIRIDATDHADIPHGSWFRLWATYPTDGGRFCFVAGPVDRNRR